ncbi:MAG: chalcone isomerase family protein [Gemmatales bacterium]|nr:chalcone isomerase family protein [Gemmatales bacterium]MDW8386011.1 chalcone isomerase family protein [Gemmatales bacterium]
MRWTWLASVVALGLVIGGTHGGETVGVPGSDTRFETVIESKIAGNKVKLRLTGTAMRKRLIFNVYAVGSYIEENSKPASAEELVALDVPKQLHLVMERDVAGKDVADNFQAAIRANYPEPQFREEIQILTEYLASQTIRKGDHIWLTHVPGVGLNVILVGKAERTIRNPKFARAVWDIYFGPNNIGTEVKRGLLARL